MMVDPSHLSGGPWREGSGLRNIARTLSKRPLHFYLDFPTRVAGALQRVGATRLAEQFLWRVHCAHPYDCPLGEHLADLFYENRQHRYPFASVERGAFIMQVLLRSYPSPRLTAAYFDNLQAVLAKRAPRAEAGRIVFGLGAGRCGSTTLAGILHSVEGAVSTHENPPVVFWEPLTRQIQFHRRRFELFSGYVPLVADCSHWWINVIDTMFSTFPTAKAIGVRREMEDCLRSWMKVSPQDLNHWVAPYNHIWLTDRWDPLYPHYEMPLAAKRDPRGAKADLVRRYVSDYNRRLDALAAALPDRVLLLRTEELDLPETRERIAEFIGLPVGTAPVRLNIGIDSDTPSADDLYF
jgi:hypothetical protein